MKEFLKVNHPSYRLDTACMYSTYACSNAKFSLLSSCMWWRSFLAPSSFSPNYRFFCCTRRYSWFIEEAQPMCWSRWFYGPICYFILPCRWPASSLARQLRGSGTGSYRESVSVSLRSSRCQPPSTSSPISRPCSSPSTPSGSCRCPRKKRSAYRWFSWRACCTSLGNPPFSHQLRKRYRDWGCDK